MTDSDTSSDEEVLFMYLTAKYQKEQQRKEDKQPWIHDICASRDEEGEYHTLFKHLMNDDIKFFQYFRMSYAKFSELLGLIEEDIKKQDTHVIEEQFLLKSDWRCIQQAILHMLNTRLCMRSLYTYFINYHTSLSTDCAVAIISM